MKNNPRIITVSGRVATGTTTLAKNLQNILNWQYINAGSIQREYDREHNLEENSQGAYWRSDDHEKEIDAMTEKILKTKKNIIYEAWLSGFFAREIKDVFRVLVICSNKALRIDRVANRENVFIEEAKRRIKKREEENIKKWKKLYGNYNFWDPKYYNLVVDTFSLGPLETLGVVLDKLEYKLV